MATNAAQSAAQELSATDPLAALGILPGVPDAVDAVRQAVDKVYGHRVMRRRSDEVAAEAALRGARGSASLAGADWPLEELRRRSDFSADEQARTVGAALRLTADGQLRNCLFSLVETDLRTPLRAGADDDTLVALWRGEVAAKRAGHGIDDESFLQPPRPMSAIGG